MAPGDPKFGADVDDVDAGIDRPAEVLIIGTGAAMERQKDPGGFLNGGDSIDMQVFLRVAINHALEHAVHIANCGGKDIYPGTFDELFCLLGCRKAF